MNNIPQGQDDSIFNSPEMGKQTLNNAVSSIKNKSKVLYNNSLATMQNSIAKLQNITNRPETIIGLIIVILIALIIAYVMYNYIANSLFNQSRLVVSATKLPVICNIKNKIEMDRKLASGNGLKRSYTFWIYIKDMSHQFFKNVLYIGSETSLKDRSPQIFLDKNMNKLYIRFSKKYSNSPGYINESDVFDNKEDQPSIESMFSQDIDNGSCTEFRKYMEQGVCIEYVPIQRWVHIGIVVNDYGTSQGGSITTYVDGELVGHAGHGEECRGICGDGQNPHTYNITDLDLDRTDNIIIGGSHDVDNNPGFAGLLCKFTMFNYDLNDRDIHNNYNEGPIDNIMAKLGLGAYGLRSPIYRIS